MRDMSLKRTQIGAALKKLQSKVPSTKIWDKLSLPSSSSPTSPRADREKDIKKGFFAVYVGGDHNEPKRYAIPLAFLKLPAFAELLRRADEEFGFSRGGGIHIPCDAALFDRFLWLVATWGGGDEEEEESRAPADSVEELLELLTTPSSSPLSS